MKTTENAPPRVVVMGVSGAGKSTVGLALADRLGVPFLDADDLHPAANVAKMSAGVALTDDDRWPWLALVGQALAAARGTGLVVACSALKRSYRDSIAGVEPATLFVHLSAERAVLERNVGGREGHFMPPALLDSQLATLEPLQAGERGVTVDAAASVEAIVDAGAAAIAAAP